MSFSIYKLTSPSGKCYIGVSKDVKSRWSSHKSRARKTAHKRHPLYDAMRAYGFDTFSVDTLETFDSLDVALQAEVDAIASHQATDRTKGYNVSAGGEYDASSGGRVFWDRIRKDPEKYAIYIENLKEGCRNGHNPRPEHLIAYNAALPAKVRWRQLNRGVRVSARLRREGKIAMPSFEITDEYREKMSASVKASWRETSPSYKKRWAMKAREDAFAQWARRTDQEIREVAAKISIAQKLSFKNPVRKANNAVQLASARNSIDRSKQGPAASKGLKAYWAKLKENPEEYAKAMAKRVATRKANE